MLKKGTLWNSIVRTTEHARSAGAIFPIPTDPAFIEDGGIRFVVRVQAGLRLKDEARKNQEAGARTGRTINPFLPPEKDLTVGEITDTHIALLNKFNVVDHHLLLVTRHFEDQDMLLTLRDFEALWLCMAEFKGLAFYNGGREAGASQQHKHLQLAPLPLAPEGPEVPIEPLLAEAHADGIGAVPGFAFSHSFVRLGPSMVSEPYKAARETLSLYSDMLRRLDLQPPRVSGPTLQSMPYCLLLTRDWMLLVPRTREFFEDISLNALSFAGSLFVRDREQLDRLKAAGPMHALRSVAMT